jgi:uncharacterized protein YecE (DUF72 family)
VHACSRTLDPTHAPALAILRLYGRNTAIWETKGHIASSERFDYEEQEAELREFVPSVLHLKSQEGHVHVAFNNHLRDQSIRGATAFSGLQDDSPISP